MIRKPTPIATAAQVYTTTVLMAIIEIHRKESFSHHLIQYGTEQRLLVCNALSPFLRDYCHQYNINYIDGAGNARIIRAGVYILIQGNKLKVKHRC